MRVTILEDIKAGRLVVVPGEALADLCDAVMADVSEAKRRLDADIPKDAPVHPVSAFLAGTAPHIGKARASPDHTAGLIALVEEMERERDEAAKAFASGAYDDACKREAGIHQHALAFTVEQFRKAEARALAAEAERDALREALAKAEAFKLTVASLKNQLTAESERAGRLETALRDARALTEEQPNVGE